MKIRFKPPSGPINSQTFFKGHLTIWQLLGTDYRQAKWRKLYMVYSLLLNSITTIWFPIHLGLLLFRNASLAEDVLNLSIFATTLACSLKTILYGYNFYKIQLVEELLCQLDSRVKSLEERFIYDQLRTHLKAILLMFTGFYLTVGVFAELGFLFQDGRQLMYSGWFPFDWANSTSNFYLAHSYQTLGFGVLLLHNYVNDCYPPVMTCLISAHIKMLYVRFENLGKEPNLEAEDELEACITDHKRLLDLFQIIESFMSLPMLIQLTMTGLSLCTSMAALLFFVTDSVLIVYFILYSVGLPLQIFPICYYATDCELKFGQLPYAAFSSNWLPQSRSFKQKLRLFVERSLKKRTALAGGMLRIHVDTFFSTLKFTYSLFTIITRMRK